MTGDMSLRNQMKYGDKDSFNKRHDEICYWLDEYITCGAFLKWYNIDYKWGPEDIEEWQKNILLIKDGRYPIELSDGREIEDIQMPIRPPRHILGEPIWEYVIRGKSSLIGFLDIVINIRCSGGVRVLPVYREVAVDGKRYTKREAIIDIEQQVTWYDYKLGFEVKSSASSTGALLRQLKTYSFHTDKMPIYVVADLEDRQRDIIWRHGYGYINPSLHEENAPVCSDSPEALG